MSWNEIQLKWAAMARRVRSDLAQQGEDRMIPPALPPPVPPGQGDRRLLPPPDRSVA